MPRRYLILHLNSNGDILYATAIARQLKTIDDPGCHITWAVASCFKNILLNNPYIDDLWVIPAENYLDIKNNVFRKTQKEVNQRMAKGEWDEVICPQLMYENMWRYDGTVRRAVLKAYKNDIADVTPTLKLTEDETVVVRLFAEKNKLSSFKHVVLFECSPLSGQSKVTPDFALRVCKRFENSNDIVFILSSNKPIETTLKNVIDGSIISFRQNAALTHYCTMLIGCSSGITWISTSDAAKPLPMLQLNSTGINPVGRDFEREGKDNSRLVEMFDFDEGKVQSCIELMLAGNIKAARSEFNSKVPPDMNFLEGILLYLLNHKLYNKAGKFITNNLKQSGYDVRMIARFASLPFRLPILLYKKRKT